MEPLPENLRAVLDSVDRTVEATTGPVVFLTGAGISAESGIPTFRGEEGFWRVGSRNYQPQELATYGAFRSMTEEIWAWYLYRHAMCEQAEPNPAHVALADLEARLGSDFLLVTQNVDGLHLRAGNTPDRTYQIHGNLGFLRCAADCTGELTPMPDRFASWKKGQPLDDDARDHLTCPRCGDWRRPHVLWFDECYDEERYRFESSMAAAETCRVLVVVGTSGATTLPMHVASAVAARGAPFVVVDPEPSAFSSMAEASPLGCFAPGRAGDLVPPIARALGRAHS